MPSSSLQRIAAAAIAGVMSFALPGSVLAAPAPQVQEVPPEQIYAEALTQLDKGNWEPCAKTFDEVERQHPYSVWARRAMLMSAYCYYQGNKYTESVQASDRFITLHPGNKDAPYAYYLKAVANYEQIVDVGRDQRRTEAAMGALSDLIRRFPQTDYARDARLKLDLTRDHLAGKEMSIGRYYLKRGEVVAAISRFRTVVEKYQTTSHVPEALHRLVEAFLSLGVIKEAQSAAAVLGNNYPGSEWYEDSYAMMGEYGNVENKFGRPLETAMQRPAVAPKPATQPAPPVVAVPPASPTAAGTPQESVEPVAEEEGWFDWF